MASAATVLDGMMVFVATQFHTCSRCGEHGHNARSCSNLPLSPQALAERAAARRRASYERNKANISAAHRRYYEANKPKVLARTSAYLKRNRTKANEKYRLRWRTDPKLRERKKAWRQANPGKAREYNRRWIEANPEVARERSRRWREANPEKAAEADRRWRRANPDKVRAHNLLRDYRSATAPGRSTAVEIAARAAFYGFVCSYCGGPFEHMDHVISLARQGTNWPANLRPACEPCNLRKGARNGLRFALEAQTRRGVAKLPLP